MAEWSKALVLGTSLFGGVGSNPTAAKYNFCRFEDEEMKNFDQRSVQLWSLSPYNSWFCQVVRMAEWSKAPDSSVSLPEYGHIEPSGPRMWAWVRIPLLTDNFHGKTTVFQACLQPADSKKVFVSSEDSNLEISGTHRVHL